MNIEEVLAKITLSQHKLEVYQDIETYLTDYMPSDTGNASEVLKVSVPCLLREVSIEAIECILGELNKLKTSEKEVLLALNAMEATDGKSKRKPAVRTRKSGARKSPAKPPAKPKQRPRKSSK